MKFGLCSYSPVKFSCWHISADRMRNYGKDISKVEPESFDFEIQR